MEILNAVLYMKWIPPLTYKQLLTELSNTLDITSMLLRPH